MQRLFLFAMLLFYSLPIMGFAQGWNIEMLDLKYTVWHSAEVIACQGDYVYLGLDHSSLYDGGIAVIDISDIEDPIEAGYYETIDDINVIEIHGDYAYIGYLDEGLVVLDISVPADPIEIAVFPALGGILDIFIDDNLAYFTGPFGRLKIADISDPANIIFLYENSYVDGGRAVYVYEDIAYLSGTGVLRIIDVSDPALPVWVNTLGPLPGDPYDFDVYEGHLYAALGFYGLHIYDISDPVNPAIAGSNVCETYDVIVSDNTAYLRQQGYALTIYDVSSPASPFYLGQIQTGHFMKDNVLSGDYILTAYDDHGFMAIDVSDPANPVEYPSYEPDWQIKDVALSGDYAFVIDDDEGLLVFDVSDPASMIHAAYLNLNPGADRIIISGNFAYIACTVDSLRIVDISNPLDPVIVSAYPSNGFIREIDEVSQLAYLSAGCLGLEIIDIRDPANLVQIGTYSSGYRSIGNLTVNGDYIYAIASEYSDYCGDSLLVVDIEDMSNPVFAGYYYAPNSSSQLEVYDGILILSANEGLFYYDITDPASPQLIDQFDMHYGPNSFEIHWDCMYYIADGLRIMDISDLMNPVQTGYYVTPGNPHDFARDGNFIFVADYDHFESFDCDNAVEVKPDIGVTTPSILALYPPCPNPFNPATTISFELVTAGFVELKVFNITGREVASLVNGHLSLGMHEVVWDAEGMVSGVYFVRMEVQCAETLQHTNVKKVVLVK